MTIGAPGSKTGSGQRSGFGGRGGGATKYDPRTKTGLLPSTSANGGTRSDGQGATYFMAGGAISARDPVYSQTNPQKEAEAKIRRAKEAAEKRDEELLKGLMRRQHDSGAVRAMKVGEKALRRQHAEGADGKGKGKEVPQDEEDSDEEDEEDRKERLRREKAIKAAYTPDMVKKLGLDPRTIHGGVSKEKRVLPSLSLPLRPLLTECAYSPTFPHSNQTRTGLSSSVLHLAPESSRGCLCLSRRRSSRRQKPTLPQGLCRGRAPRKTLTRSSRSSLHRRRYSECTYVEFYTQNGDIYILVKTNKKSIYNRANDDETCYNSINARSPPTSFRRS